MTQVHQKCEDLLLYCTFNSKIKKCSEIFTLIKTYEGYCCAFNYAALNEASMEWVFAFENCKRFLTNLFFIASRYYIIGWVKGTYFWDISLPKYHSIEMRHCALTGETLRFAFVGARKSPIHSPIRNCSVKNYTMYRYAATVSYYITLSYYFFLFIYYMVSDRTLCLLYFLENL